MKASINYEAMAEGFTRALAEIGQELATAKNLQALYETEEMSSVVISLYSHVLSFLQFSMKWIKSFGKTSKCIFFNQTECGTVHIVQMPFRSGMCFMA